MRGCKDYEDDYGKNTQRDRHGVHSGIEGFSLSMGAGVRSVHKAQPPLMSKPSDIMPSDASKPIEQKNSTVANGRSTFA
jgi:hypothetical protein